jgi:hypothetical protein
MVPGHFFYFLLIGYCRVSKRGSGRLRLRAQLIERTVKSPFVRADSLIAYGTRTAYLHPLQHLIVLHSACRVIML